MTGSVLGLPSFVYLGGCVLADRCRREPATGGPDTLPPVITWGESQNEHIRSKGPKRPSNPHGYAILAGSIRHITEFLCGNDEAPFSGGSEGAMIRPCFEAVTKPLSCDDCVRFRSSVAILPQESSAWPQAISNLSQFVTPSRQAGHSRRIDFGARVGCG